MWDVFKFLQLPDDTRVKECYQQFYNAMSNEAVQMVVCAVCAWEVDKRGDQVT